MTIPADKITPGVYGIRYRSVDTVAEVDAAGNVKTTGFKATPTVAEMIELGWEFMFRYVPERHDPNTTAAAVEC